MQIVHNVNIHLDRREQLPAIDAVQGETGRVLSVTLFDKGELWPIPDNARAVVRYGKDDFTGGIYDTLPNGEAACAISGSTVTVAIPGKMLSAPGFVGLQILLCQEDAVLSTFTIRVRVEADPSANTAAEGTYVNLLPGLMEAADLAAEAADAAQASATAADAAAKEAKRTAASITSRYDLTYTAHWVDETTGDLEISTVTATSQLFPVLGGAIGLAFPNTVAARLCYYDRSGAFLGKDTLRYDSFQRTGITADYARVEAIYTNGGIITDYAGFGSQIMVYVPAPSLEDVERAVVAVAQAEEYCTQAQTAAWQAKMSNGLVLGSEVSPSSNTYADSCFLAVRVIPNDLTSGNTKLTLEKKDARNPDPTRLLCYVDFQMAMLGFYGKCSDSDPMTVVAARPMELPVVAGREYEVRLTLLPDGDALLTVTDCCTLQSEEFPMPAAPIGNGWGGWQYRFYDGGMIGMISGIHSQLLQPEKPRVLVLGDELVEARTLTDQGFAAADRFASLIREAVGGSCFINARGGATAQTVAGWFDSYLSGACHPTYAVVAVGCSDTDYDLWVAGMESIIEKLKALGATPILMTLPAGNGPNRDILTQQNAWIRRSRCAYIDACTVTSLNFEGTSADPSLYMSDGIHLNPRGHKQVFLRARLDVPELMG